MNPESLEKLKKKILAIDEAVTMQELSQAIDALLTFAKKLEGKTEKDLEAIIEYAKSALERVQSTISDTTSKSEQKLMSKLDSTLNTILLEHESRMSEVDKKMSEMKDGKDADEEAIAERVKSSIEIPEMPEIEDETPESVRDLLEELINRPENEKLDPRAIKGWEEFMKKIDEIDSRPRVVANVGRDITDIDISSQLDGVTKTFNIQNVWKIVTVDLSSFPNALRKGIDYTWTPTSITFTDQIEASTSLNTGQTCIITAVI